MRLDADKDYLVCDYCSNIYVPDPNDDGVRVLEETTANGGLVECPVCAIPLFHAALDGQRILYCQRCRGMLIDMDIFAPLVEDLRSRQQAVAELVLPVDSKELDRRLLCPHCRAEMDAHIYGGGGNVVIDDCEPCQVNWLDHGELARIVRSADRQFTYGL